MSLSTKNTTPITADGLFHELGLGHLDPTTLVGIGVNTDGTLITIREFPKKIRNKLVPGTIHHYTLTDVPSAAGSFTVLQGTKPWTTALPAGYVGQAVLAQGVSNGKLVFTVDVIVKTFVITTSATAGARSLFVASSFPASSKTAAPSATSIDLLDRELAIPKGKTLSVLNWDGLATGDLAYATWVQVI